MPTALGWRFDQADFRLIRETAILNYRKFLRCNFPAFPPGASRYGGPQEDPKVNTALEAAAHPHVTYDVASHDSPLATIRR